MNKLSKKALAGIIAGVAGVSAIGVGLGITQPWNKEKPLPPPPENEQIQQPQTPEETGLTLTVNGQEIPCTVYEGDGWSIYVPVGWQTEEKENGVTFTDGAVATVVVSSFSPETVGWYEGAFVSISPEKVGSTSCLKRIYHADTPRGGEICCVAPRQDWSRKEGLFNAMVRSYQADGTSPFSSVFLVADEPEWQTDGDSVVLWMGKEGYIVNEEAAEAVEEQMLAWPAETKKGFAGKYRVRGVTWAGSYTGMASGYMDVFRAEAWYEVKTEDGQLPDMVTSDWIREGNWVRDPKNLAVTVHHDGDAVTREVRIWCENEVVGEASFAGALAEKIGLKYALSEQELKTLEAWFNQEENNGLLRFPIDPQQPANLQENLIPNLKWLFYDLGASDFTQAEKKEIDRLIEEKLLPDGQVTRLTRQFVTEYLQEKLGMSALEAADALKTGGEGLGCYLEMTDAWYISHGDTEMRKYTFAEGDKEPTGRRIINYTTPFVRLPGDALGSAGVDMQLHLIPHPSKPGEWVVEKNIPHVE